MKKCPKCGSENPKNANFCKKCGKSLLNVKPETQSLRRTGNHNGGQNYNHKRYKYIVFLIAVIIILIGWMILSKSSNERHSSEESMSIDVVQSAKSKKTTESTSKLESSSSSQTVKLWNSNKASQLASFMQSWGNQMNQQYENCGEDTNNDVDFHDYHFPNDFGNINYRVNNEPVSVTWSADGQGDADYNVVAIYSDANNPSSAGTHLYFFAIHNGSPIVLITEQSDGENQLNFKETANRDLRAGFEKIVNEN